MALETANEILGLKDRKVKKIKVPVWNKEVHIKQMSVAQRDMFNKMLYGKRTQTVKKREVELVAEMSAEGLDAQVCIWGVVDSEGKPLFKENHKASILEMHPEAIGFISAEILYYSGIVPRPDEEEEVEIKKLEKAVKK